MLQRVLFVSFAFLAVHCADAAPAPAPTSEGIAEAQAKSPAQSVDERAGTLTGGGEWEGTGTTRDLSGRDIARFAIALRRAPAGPQKERTEGTITFADGRTTTFWQDLESHGGTSFSLVTSSGTGGGQCFANGLCQTYEQRDGHAFATTLAKDGPSKMRVLSTELDGGKAVRFVEQTLLRK